MKFRIAFLFVALTCSSIWAQNALVNIKGTVLDERTGKPLGKEMDMVIVSQKTGKKFVVKVNSSTGEYLQPLESGHRYSITFQSYAIYRKQAEIEIPPMQKFKEFVYDFTVRSLQEGEPLVHVRAFRAGNSQLTQEGQTGIAHVHQLLKENRHMRIVIELARELTEPPPEPKPTAVASSKKRASKKKKISEPPPPPPPPPTVNEQLYQARLDTLKAQFSDIRDAEIRLQFRGGTEQPFASSEPNLRILTGPVKDIFEE